MESKKKVVIVGVLDKIGSTNVSQAKAFLQFGYDVIPVNYRTIIGRDGHDFLYKHIIHIVKTYKPDLVLFSKCNGIESDIIRECNKYTKTWLWNPDPIQTIEACPEVLEHAKISTFSSCTGGGVVDWFKENGVRNCYHIFEGIDPHIYRPVETIEKVKAEISFIGSATELRVEYAKFLQSKDVDIKVFGPGFNTEIVNEAFAQVCSSSRYMLSLNTQNDIPDYFSDRVFRYTACGACVFHLDKTNTMNNYFEDGKEIIIFKNKNELLDKLNKMTDEEAFKIAMNGREHTLNNYTWQHTIARVIEISGL